MVLIGLIVAHLIVSPHVYSNQQLGLQYECVCGCLCWG